VPTASFQGRPLKPHSGQPLFEWTIDPSAQPAKKTPLACVLATCGVKLVAGNHKRQRYRMRPRQKVAQERGREAHSTVAAREGPPAQLEGEPGTPAHRLHKGSGNRRFAAMQSTAIGSGQRTHIGYPKSFGDLKRHHEFRNNSRTRRCQTSTRKMTRMGCCGCVDLRACMLARLPRPPV